MPNDPLAERIAEAGGDRLKGTLMPEKIAQAVREYITENPEAFGLRESEPVSRKSPIATFMEPAGTRLYALPDKKENPDA